MTRASLIPISDADRAWALSEAAKPRGFLPHAQGTVDLLLRLEFEGLVRRSDHYAVWFITDDGRAELEHLQARAAQ